MRERYDHIPNAAIHPYLVKLENIEPDMYRELVLGRVDCILCDLRMDVLFRFKKFPGKEVDVVIDLRSVGKVEVKSLVDDTGGGKPEEKGLGEGKSGEENIVEEEWEITGKKNV